MPDEAEEFEFLKGMVELSKGFERMASIGASYRGQLEAAGFSPTIAEQVAAHFLMEQQAAMMRSQT